ncbi:MAG: tyrosine-type recombinase/integrase [Cytophagales bacterium]|nr:tyrosine-type recombinase/integrase [Cytophagales bacterium]MDW3197417.1 tyrosine-type recombinase/integrase [Cytophagales bacterium]
MNQEDYQKTKDSFSEYLKSKEFTNKSIQTRMTVFNQYLLWADQENLEPEQITYNDLLLYLKYCQGQGLQQRTIKSHIALIKHYYNYLIRERIITLNPTTDINVKGARRKVLYHIMEPHELHQLYHEFPCNSLAEKRNRIMLGLFVYQGLRTEEVGRLEVQHIKLREGKIDVLGGRNSNERLIQLESYQVMDMHDYILQVRPELMKMEPKRRNQQKQETDLLFIGQGGQRYSINNFITQTMISARSINPDLLNAKHIRASVITKWLKLYNLREVQYLAGHRYISSTESYLQNDLEELKEEVQQYHPLG